VRAPGVHEAQEDQAVGAEDLVQPAARPAREQHLAVGSRSDRRQPVATGPGTVEAERPIARRQDIGPANRAGHGRRAGIAVMLMALMRARRSGQHQRAQREAAQ
ncbi:hypothetical protein RZS08_36985, partial [Arthrospira platensis SPKY1]|nr:hypothetical protein [Arthrospira platensis SPKY1]